MALTTRLPSMKVEPFHGFVETTGDALRLIQAARSGIIPRITRRLNDLERRAMIKSGSIFIFSDEESGIKRWTEGLSWSASRIVGNFLVYREVTERVGTRATSGDKRSTCRRRTTSMDAATAREQRLSKSLVGCLNDTSGRFKSHGLVKKTITISVEGSDHHLIAYYRQEDVRLGKLLPLSSRSDIMSLDIPPELLESTKFRVPPVTRDGPDGRPRYLCDADESDVAQSHLFHATPNTSVMSTAAMSRLIIPPVYSPASPTRSTTKMIHNLTAHSAPNTPTDSGEPCNPPIAYGETFNWLPPLSIGERSRCSSVSSSSEPNHNELSPCARTRFDAYFLTPYVFAPSPQAIPRIPMDTTQVSSPTSSTHDSPQPASATVELPVLPLWGSGPLFEQTYPAFNSQPNMTTTHYAQGESSAPMCATKEMPSNLFSLSMSATSSLGDKDLLDSISLPLHSPVDVYPIPTTVPFFQQPVVSEQTKKNYYQLFGSNSQQQQTTWT